MVNTAIAFDRLRRLPSRSELISDEEGDHARAQGDFRLDELAG
jgi:hypothetical protein